MKNINELSKHLINLNIKLVTAESCTGGLIAKLCTDYAGSSAWFECGIVTYSNQSKIKMLGVDVQLIKQYGAVSQLVAESMAQGALDFSLGGISVSVTGIAGPDGGSEEKPVGTVWIAWAMQSQLVSEQFNFEGNRSKVREQTAKEAINGVILMLQPKN